MVGKSLNGSMLAYIPTAANVESGDKGWMIKDLNNFKNAGLDVDIVDISAVAKEVWLPRLEAAELLCFGGGNTFHLMHWIAQSGLQNELSALLRTRIYVGISAGSCIAGPTIYNSLQYLFGEKSDLEIREGLGLVPFLCIPHLNSPHFEKLREANLKDALRDVHETVYALDDNSALVINDGDVRVVSEGRYIILNA
jgi:dipeptidase E